MERKFKDFIKAKRKLEKNGLYKGIVAFGSARIFEDNKHYQEVVNIANLCAKRVLEKNKKISFITGGGPAIMTAWLQGAYRKGIQTAGLFMPLQQEKELNKYAIKKISCIVDTLESRKAILFEYAKCVVVFKGGYGTFDEIFALITLIRTGLMKPIPIFVYPADFYKDVFNFKNLLEEGTINRQEAQMLTMCNTQEELLGNLYKFIDNDKD